MDLTLVAPRELDLAVKLIGELAGKFEPEKFRDKYREQVEALIAAKIAGRDVLVSGRRRARGDRASCQHYGRAEEKPGGCAQGSGPAPNLRTRARNRKSAMQKAGALKAQAETNRPVRAPAGANLEGLCYKSGHARIYAITP
ncbi:MAG: hypothetical protein DMG57_17720 [Acidobacteria bacterium]|nr:MAG: hypothetical protein DMG57_17720 [Acidobacteriota bacterium]